MLHHISRRIKQFSVMRKKSSEFIMGVWKICRFGHLEHIICEGKGSLREMPISSGHGQDDRKFPSRYTAGFFVPWFADKASWSEGSLWYNIQYFLYYLAHQNSIWLPTITFYKRACFMIFFLHWAPTMDSSEELPTNLPRLVHSSIRHYSMTLSFSSPLLEFVSFPFNSATECFTLQIVSTWNTGNRIEQVLQHNGIRRNLKTNPYWNCQLLRVLFIWVSII